MKDKPKCVFITYRIPRESVERLEALGRWMADNSEAIYSTRATPFKHMPWGRCTRKSMDHNTTRLYLHVFNWPNDGQLVVPGLRNNITHTFLLADPTQSPLKVIRSDGEIEIAVPKTAPDKSDSVVVVDIEGEPEIQE